MINKKDVYKLGDIATFSQGIQVGLKEQLKEPKDGYVRFIRIVDYTQNTKDIRYVKDPGEKYFVDEDDIVMVRYGSPGLIGRGKKGVIANNMFQIKPKVDFLTKDYLVHYLSQPHIQLFLSTQGSSTMPALNFQQLKTVDVKVPSIEVQNKIVVNLNKLNTDFYSAQQILNEKLNLLVELKNSIHESNFIF
tara:strand:+ start:1650 stop:2222 length:573 start_codon:yes stop_codon:yes gene_type:complete